MSELSVCMLVAVCLESRNADCPLNKAALKTMTMQVQGLTGIQH